MPTYILRSTATATGVHVALIEDAISTATAAGATATATIPASSSAFAFAFSSDAGIPNNAAWPSGTYSVELNVTTAGANIIYGLRLINVGFTGHFARVNSGLTSDLETVTQAEGSFTGTGIKVATASWSPTAGAASDRLEVLIAADNSATMSQTLVLTLNTTDNEFLFPDVAATKAPPPFQRQWRRLQRKVIA